MKTATHPHSLSKVLKRLMAEHRVDDAALSEATRVPFTTIARLRANACANPTASSLRPLAEFFGVSISQLLGDHPLPVAYEDSAFEKSCYRFPVVRWRGVLPWVSSHRLETDAIEHWIVTQLPLASGSFATCIENRAYTAPFLPGNILIVDPTVVPVSRDIVLIHTPDCADVMLKEIIVDGGHTYLRALHPELKEIITLRAPYTLCGVVMEVRQPLHDNSGLKGKRTLESVSSNQPMIEQIA